MDAVLTRLGAGKDAPATFIFFAPGTCLSELVRIIGAGKVFK
jgi:hypothetical protein